MEDIKLIHFKRSGGFSGVTVETSVNIGSLTTEEAASLKKIIDDSGVQNLSPTAKSADRADRFSYSITIETGQQKQTIEFDEPQVNQKVKPLINYFLTKARKQ